MAGKYWSPEAAIPGAIAAVWHNISGAIFTFLARRIDAKRAAQPAHQETKQANPEEVPTPVAD